MKYSLNDINGESTWSSILCLFFPEYWAPNATHIQSRQIDSKGTEPFFRYNFISYANIVSNDGSSAQNNVTNFYVQVFVDLIWEKKKYLAIKYIIANNQLQDN